MMNHRNIGVILLLLAVFAIVCNAEEQPKKKGSKKAISKQNAKLDPRSCGQYTMVGEPCCKIPLLTKKEVFQGCWKESGFGGPSFHKARLHKAKLHKAKLSAAKQGEGSKKTKRHAKKDTGDGKVKKAAQSNDDKIMMNRGPGCLVECLMRNMSVLNSDGLIDKEKVKAAFVEASDVNKEEIAKSTEDCHVLYMKANHKVRSATNCPQAMGQFLTCVRRDLEIKLTTITTDERCKIRLNGLKECDPFYVNPQLQEKMKTMAKKFSLKKLNKSS